MAGSDFSEKQLLKQTLENVLKQVKDDLTQISYTQDSEERILENINAVFEKYDLTESLKDETVQKSLLNKLNSETNKPELMAFFASRCFCSGLTKPCPC